MKSVSETNQFLKDIKRMLKRGKDLAKMKRIINLLSQGEKLPPKYRDHPLIGPWQGARDCHIEPDWLLIYTMDLHHLNLVRTGTHSDLFE